MKIGRNIIGGVLQFKTEYPAKVSLQCDFWGKT